MRVGRVGRLTNETVVLLVSDIDQAAVNPAVDSAGLKGAVEITVDIVGQGQGKARIIAVCDEAGRGEVFIAVVVQDNVGVDQDFGLVRLLEELAEIRFGAVKAIEVKPVED